MQRDMLRIAREVSKLGHEVDIYTISWEGDLPKGGINVHVIPTQGLFNYVKYRRFISETYARVAVADKSGRPFDLIVGFNRMDGLDVYFAADPCFVERAHVQRNWLYRKTPRYRWFARCEESIFRPQSATEILLLSEIEKRHFQKWYGTQDERFHFIPPYLSKERFVLKDKQTMRQYLRNAFGFGENDFVYLLVGSGFAMKGLDRAILALASLPASDLAGARLVAVGQDNPKPFMQMAQKLGVAEHVVISKGRPDIPDLMQGADVYVHPAYRENTGLVILESLACGLPALVTATCGYAFHVREAKAGLVAESPFDQQDFNRLFLQMMRTGDRGQWSQNGLVYARKLMDANDGSAEARVLIRAAENKLGIDT